MQRFKINTGVRQSSGSPALKFQYYDGAGVKQIIFYCEGVPAGAVFKFATDNANLETESLKRFEILDGGLVSKYAYFQIKK